MPTLQYYNEDGELRAYLVDESRPAGKGRHTFLGVARGRDIHRESPRVTDPEHTVVESDPKLGMPGMSAQTLRRLSGLHGRPLHLEHIRAEARRQLAESRRRVGAAREVMRERKGRIGKLQALVQEMRKKLNESVATDMLKMAEAVVTVLKPFAKGGRLGKNPAPTARQIREALVDAFFGEGSWDKRLKGLVAKLLRGLDKPSAKEAEKKVLEILGKLNEDRVGEDVLSRYAERLFEQCQVPLIRGRKAKARRVVGKKGIMAALRKEWRVSPQSPFRQVLSGLDKGVRLSGTVRKALGTADEFLGLAQVMLDEEGKGGRTREQELLGTYRKMQALMKAIRKTPLIDKLPPGVAELCRWPLDVFIAMDPGMKIVAGHAARIEKMREALGRKYGDALSTYHGNYGELERETRRLDNR